LRGAHIRVLSEPTSGELACADWISPPKPSVGSLRSSGRLSYEGEGCLTRSTCRGGGPEDPLWQEKTPALKKKEGGGWFHPIKVEGGESTRNDTPWRKKGKTLMGIEKEGRGLKRFSP